MRLERGIIMEKEAYEQLEIEVIAFENEDVIEDSSGDIILPVV